ncbi:MAG: hypothetical protein SGILL_000826, partial [Bacillariaceae sp.]
VNGIETKPLQELQKQFPVHVQNDGFEDILHPGVLFSGMERIKAVVPEMADSVEKIRVPRFWDPVEFGDKGVQGFLGDNGGRFITLEEALLIGSTDPKTKLKTIFVSVASYRDSECTATIESIFARAKHPDRIRVAVVDQMDEKEDTPCAKPTTSCDEDPTQILCQYAHLIDVVQEPAFLMTGPVLARHIAHRMYRGEYYALQVDSHVRFVEDWDEDIVEQWKSANNEMAVLSTYLTGIDGSIDEQTHRSLRKERNILCNLQYDGSGSQRHFITQVPYDQYLPMLFQGEEASMAIRGFTYGYDFYAPERSVAFHIYAVKANVGRKSRHKFWENEMMFKGALEKSVARLNAITGMLGGHSSSKNNNNQHVTEDYETIENDKYGLGKVRSKEKYYDTFGIHPESQSVEGHLCMFVRRDMHDQFTSFLREDGIGIDYGKIDFAFHDQLKIDSGVKVE